VAQELSGRDAARTIINPLDVESFAHSEPNYAMMSVVDVGKAFHVDEVVQIVVTEYDLEPTVGSDQYMGRVAVDLCVVSVARQQQVYPSMDRGHTIEAGSASGITASSRSEAEKAILDALARKVGMVFVPYVIEEQPKRAEVK
jgi:hypothetical protein